MKIKIRKCGIVICLTVCLLLCSALGSRFMREPSGASAEENEKSDVSEGTSSGEDGGVETLAMSGWAEYLTDGNEYTADGIVYEYRSEYSGLVVTGREDGVTKINIPDEAVVKGLMPSNIEGLYVTTYVNAPVTAVAEKAFSGSTDITYIRIGKYVKYIGDHAFYNTTSVEKIEYCATDAENGAKAVTNYKSPFYHTGRGGSAEWIFGKTVERIDEYMFYYAYASKVSFEEGGGLREIGDYAFRYFSPCSSTDVTDFMLPGTVEKVGKYALAMSIPVGNGNVPKGLKEAGKAAFGFGDIESLHFEATDMPDLTSSDQPFYGLGEDRYYGDGKWASGKTNMTVYIGRDVTRIPDYCFYADYTKSTSADKYPAGAYIRYIYPEYVCEGGSDDGGYSLSYIGKYAFYNMTWCNDMEFPMGLEEVAPYAFSGSNVSEITLGDTDGWYAEKSDGSSVPATDRVLFAAEFMSDPSTVATYWKTTYRSYRFRWTDGFEYELSADGTYYSVTGYVGDGGDVTVKDTHRAIPVREIGVSAFENETAITSVVIPESVEKIGASAFCDCVSLASVTIRGSGLETVGSNAFYNCSALKSLYVSSASAFVSADYDGRYANPLALVSFNGGKFYVGGESYTTLSINGTERIGTYALAYCTLITSVTIVGSVETIGDCAFCGETSLTSIAIPASVTYIGENAFSSMSLSTVTFASNSGWTVTSGSTEIKLAASELQANAKDFLTSTYAGYVWTRTVYDHSAPTVESKVESGGYTNSAISITTTVDGDSSIWYIAYTDPAGNTYYVYDHSLTLSSENLTVGMYTFVSVDADGIESDPYYITYDDVAPDLYVGGMAAWVNYSSTEFSVMAYDSSPVTMYSSRDGGASWTLCASNPYTVYPETDYATDGEYWFVAVDAAGNVTGPYYTVLDTIAVTGDWAFDEDMYLYFGFEAPSYTEWSCTMNGEPYTSGTKLRTCQTTYYVSLVGKNGTSLTTDYTLYHYYPEEGVYTEPTCSAYGYTTYSCVYCGDTYVVVDLYSSSTSHNYEERRIEPSCTEKGSYWYVCADCGDSTTPVEIDALGHDPVVDQMIAATCTTDGYTGKICSRCGVLLEGEIIPATGHSYLAVSYSATCRELAKTVYTCSICGDTFEVTTGTYLADHVWGDWDHVSPTCTETGFESRQCEVCGETEEYVLKATGHSYTSAVWHEWTDEETGKIYRYRYCDLCGEDGIDWYDADDPTEVASNGVIDLFEKYQKYMWWIFLAFVGLWSIVIGIRWALQRSDQERVKTRSMLANYIIGLFVIAIILVGLPYLIYGIAILVA